MPTYKWTNWEDAHPGEDAKVWWRLKSETLEGVYLLFRSSLIRINNQLCPPFSHWDGWKVIVPPCEWSTGEEPPYGEGPSLRVEDLTLLPCPYCGSVPELVGHRLVGGGIIPCASPSTYNTWELKCCSWGSSPRGDDPRSLERERRNAFSMVRKLEVYNLG